MLQQVMTEPGKIIFREIPEIGRAHVRTFPFSCVRSD